MEFLDQDLDEEEPALPVVSLGFCPKERAFVLVQFHDVLEFLPDFAYTSGRARKAWHVRAALRMLG